MKKQKGKKKKFEQEKIVPVKHQKVGNLNYYSEEIAKEIIDKLISLAITQIFKDKIYPKIPNFCFESVKHFLNLVISISYIKYDRDNIYDIENIFDGEQRLNTDENRYKIKNHSRCNKIRYKNAEEDMLEFANINLDIEKEMYLKNKNINDFLNKSYYCDTIINRKKKKKSNFWGKIMQPTTYSPPRNIPKSNALNKQILLLDKKEITKKKQKQNVITKKKNIRSRHNSLYSKKQSASSLRESSKKLDIKSLNENLVKKEKKYFILIMDKMKKIEIDKNKKEEPDEIKELRKLELERIRLLKEEEELKKNKKRGNQEEIKYVYNLDTINLPKKDRGKNVQAQRRIIEEQIKRGNFTIDFNNNLILVRQVQPDKLEKDFPEPITRQKKGENDNLNEIKDNQKLLSMNSGEKTEIKKNYLDDNSSNTMANYFNYKYGWKIDPSGSNFKLIKPETGVNLYEEGEIKSGGDEYYEKYKRFSQKDYTKILNDILSQQTFLKKQAEEENIKEPSDIPEKKDKMNVTQEIPIIKEKEDFFSKKMKQIQTKGLIRNKMLKSNSQIFALNKISLYQNLFVYDNKDSDVIKSQKINKDLFSYRIKRHNLLFRKMNNIVNKKENKSLQILDNFNTMIMRNINPFLKKNKELNNLPIIPLRKNKSEIFSMKNINLREKTKFKKE